MPSQQMSLAKIAIQRAIPRSVDQRQEPRYTDIVERADIFFRGERHAVRVVNISSRGTMIESEIMPRLGETVLVQFESCSRIHAFVRWVREGRIGLNFGHEIVLA